MKRLTEIELEGIIKGYLAKYPDDEMTERILENRLKDLSEPLLSPGIQERLLDKVLAIHEKNFTRRLFIRFCVYLMLFPLAGLPVFFLLSRSAAMSIINMVIEFKWPLFFSLVMLMVIEYFNGIRVRQKMLAFRQSGGDG